MFRGKRHVGLVSKRWAVERFVVVVVVVVVVETLQALSRVHSLYMSQPTSSAFEAFREHLDDHCDRRERIIKVSTFFNPEFLILLNMIGESRCICGLQEGHLLAASNFKRDIR
jgi:hypothetical protein